MIPASTIESPCTVSVKKCPFLPSTNSGGIEKAYEGEYNLSLPEGGTASFSHEWTVPADAGAQSELVLQFMLGRSPAGNTFTVNSVTVEEWVPEHTETVSIEPTYYPETLSGKHVDAMLQ